MNKISHVQHTAFSSRIINKKPRILPTFLCSIIIAASMTGCEKASERIIYISPIDTESSVESTQSDFTGQIETIGAGKLLEAMTFKLDGTEIHLNKKRYSDLKEMGWSFDPKAYGLENLVAEIGCIYQRSIFLLKNGYDPDVFCIGITNFETTPCGIEDIQLWSIEFTAHGKTKYPEIIINGGVTWHSSKEDIIKAYGEPVSSERNDIAGSTVMHYTDNSGSDVYFEVYDNEGVGKITLEMYKP